MPLGVTMNYAPSKKKIVFSDELKTHPNFPDVMEAIKACGDHSFKSWLIHQASLIASNMPTHTEIDQSNQAALIATADNLTELVGRQSQVDDGVIYNCKAMLEGEPRWEVISLLAKVTGFLLSIQRFEKQIALIERDIERGVVVTAAQSRPLTRDGSAPSYTPRSRQANTRYKA